MFIEVAQSRKEENSSSSFVTSCRCVGVGLEEEKVKRTDGFVRSYRCVGAGLQPSTMVRMRI